MVQVLSGFLGCVLFFTSLLSLTGLVGFGPKIPILGTVALVCLTIACNRPSKAWHAREEKAAVAWKKRLEDPEFFLGLVSLGQLEKLIISKMWGKWPISTPVAYDYRQAASSVFPGNGFQEYFDQMLWDGSLEFATIHESGAPSRIRHMAFKIGEPLLEKARQAFPLENFEVSPSINRGALLD